MTAPLFKRKNITETLTSVLGCNTLPSEYPVFSASFPHRYRSWIWAVSTSISLLLIILLYGWWCFSLSKAQRAFQCDSFLFLSIVEAFDFFLVPQSKPRQNFVSVQRPPVCHYLYRSGHTGVVRTSTEQTQTWHWFGLCRWIIQLFKSIIQPRSCLQEYTRTDFEEHKKCLIYIYTYAFICQIFPLFSPQSPKSIN